MEKNKPEVVIEYTPEKTVYSFPDYGLSVEAENLQDAVEKLQDILKKRSK
jgi:hypothetical protein